LQATQPIADLFARLPNCRLYNQYGPTESHVVTSFALGSDPADWPSLPPIGRPIGNSKIYILDGCLQPVPVGVTGELYIGGDSLARGYLHQRELSQEKFIANPFDKEAGARLYRTGDLARYLADGQIQFVGRIDQQVKIRGYRIELGEIEAVLGQHPAVREAVALAREDSPGDRRVVAYVVSPPDTSTNELQSFLKQKLPEFMVPSAFVFLDSLPLTPNGKIDRNALPAPDQSRPEMEEHYIAPRTPIEELLAEIWADVLKMERVGIRDNFFDLGGHSLLATQVVSRIRETLQVDLPLRALFEAPTIAELALRIEPTAAETDKLQELNRHLGEVELLSEAETERLVKED
jgi:non-ribosomal peptide synthetase component F